MSNVADPMLATMRNLRQARRFLDRPVPPEIVCQLLDIARWTGSAKNTQPWEFVVVEDRETNTALAHAGEYTGFLENVSLSIVIVLPEPGSRSVAYDEGRVSERLMLAALVCELGSGTAWFSTPEAQQIVRGILGIPSDRVVWSAVGFGYVDTSQPQRSSLLGGGRKPLAETLSYGRYGQRHRR